uniref:Glycosyltransferase 2-like domain-containing protein n=1 Tax=viral metagenome TaxID=1070528 RepID=A0A6C0KAG5_9ZZZZ
MEGEGISFIVRIRNEETTLVRSVRSLISITIPHEIVLILHRCTDKSPEIAASLAKENPHVRILTYDHAVSRAGYETLATDATSDHSFIRYSNWCAGQARYPWIFRWDADFVMTRPLMDYINKQEWVPKNLRIGLTAKNKTHENKEYYLYQSSVQTKKYIFWEASVFPSDVISLRLENTFYVIHVSELSDVKTYWTEPPWFETDESHEAREVKERYDKLVAEFGPEPTGMARASNPKCTDIFSKITHANNCVGPSYVKFLA